MAGLHSHAALSELIGAIYECALDPAGWDATLAAIVEALDGMTAIISLSDLRDNRMLIYRQVGIDPHYEALLLKHEAEVNAEIGRNLATWPSLDQPYLLSRHTTEEERAASPYYQECVRAGGGIDVMQYFLMHTKDRFSGFAVGRHENFGMFTDGEIELSGLLLPHLRRAVAISNILDARALERERLDHTLDLVRCGVLLTDEFGTILHANSHAERMLERGMAVEALHGRLHASHDAAARELRAAIRLAVTDRASIGTTGLAVLLSEATDTNPVFAHVLPVRSAGSAAHGPGDVAAIFLSIAPDQAASVEVLAAAYGLTQAEQRVLTQILAGATLVQTARALGVALTTAKTHLEGIFAKTGVNRQADLIRLCAKAQPPVET